MSHELKEGRELRSITLPDGRIIRAGAPHKMEIVMQMGQMSMVPWVREWSNYHDMFYNCAVLLAVEPKEDH